MKKIITALILVTLIFAAFNVLPAPSVKAQVSQVKVVSYSWYVAPEDTYFAEYQGDLIVVGEVENIGSNVVGYVTLEGQAYNSSGNFVCGVESQTFPYYIEPGQKAPFYMDFRPEASVTGDQSWVPDVTNVTMTILNVNDTAAAPPYSGLTTSAVKSSDNAGTYTVTGTVKNTGDQTVTNVWVCTTFYDASGTVVALNVTTYYVSPLLAPGYSKSFTITPTDNTAQLSSEITNYSLSFMSDPLTASASPSASPSHSPSPKPSSSSTALSSKAQLPVAVIAGVVVVVVVVLAALLLLRKRQKNAQFEQPPPPPPPPP